MNFELSSNDQCWFYSSYTYTSGKQPIVNWYDGKCHGFEVDHVKTGDLLSSYGLSSPRRASFEPLLSVMGFEPMTFLCCVLSLALMCMDYLSLILGQSILYLGLLYHFVTGLNCDIWFMMADL